MESNHLNKYIDLKKDKYFKKTIVKVTINTKKSKIINTKM